MRLADFASTVRTGKMAHAYNRVVDAVRPCEDALKEIRLLVFQVSPNGITAEVGDLYHAGQAAVDEQGSLDDPFDPRPQGPLLVKAAHELGMFSRDRLVVVMHDKSKVLQFPVIGVDEVLLKAGNDLLERLLIQRSSRSDGVKVELVYALGEQASRSQLRRNPQLRSPTTSSRQSSNGYRDACVQRSSSPACMSCPASFFEDRAGMRCAPSRRPLVSDSN